MSREDLKIRRIFSEEDKKFNRKMIELSLKYPKVSLPLLDEKREYDFSSEILAAFRKKWGIGESEETSN